MFPDLSFGYLLPVTGVPVVFARKLETHWELVLVVQVDLITAGVLARPPLVTAARIALFSLILGTVGPAVAGGLSNTSSKL